MTSNGIARALKVTHIKGRLLDQAVILFNCVSSKWELLLKNLLPEFFPLRAVPYHMKNHFYHIRCPPLNVTIFIMHVCNCVIGATPMTWSDTPDRFSCAAAHINLKQEGPESLKPSLKAVKAEKNKTLKHESLYLVY